MAASESANYHTGEGGVRLRIDSRAWREGFDAGEAGRPGYSVSVSGRRPQPREPWSWHSGWIEGDAKRQGFSYSRGTMPPGKGDSR